MFSISGYGWCRVCWEWMSVVVLEWVVGSVGGVCGSGVVGGVV